MIVIEIVRISGEFLHHSVDIQWGIFWLQMEASTAIIAVSVTGFRAILNVRARREREKSEHGRGRLQSYRQRLLHKALLHHHMEQSTDLEDLPRVPGAMLTGTRTCISGNNKNNTITCESSLDHGSAAYLKTDDRCRENGHGGECSMSSVQVRMAIGTTRGPHRLLVVGYRHPKVQTSSLERILRNLLEFPISP